MDMEPELPGMSMFWATPSCLTDTIDRPSADWGSLPLEGGIEAAYKRQLDNTKTPEEREALMAKLLLQFEDVRSPLKTAHRFGVEEIIDPRDTRPVVCDVCTSLVLI